MRKIYVEGHIMTKNVIREIAGDEAVEVLYRLVSYSFRNTPPMPDKEEVWQATEKRRGATYLALFEDDVAVTCAGIAAMSQQVRGEIFPMGGIFSVASHPVARRKGYARDVMRYALASLHEKGYAFTCLYPFRESFYERLGYATFPQIRIAKFAPAALLPLLKISLDGEVEHQLIKDGFEHYRDYSHKLRKRIHGMAMFDESDRESGYHKNYWLALAKASGDVVGMMVYQIKGEWPDGLTFNALRFHYTTSLGKYLLLEWIARHIDQVSHVEIRLPPFERPETWFADLQIKTEPPRLNPMGRILDVSQISGMHTGPGQFSARIIDPFCPWNESLWQFKTQDGILQVTPAQEADCELTIQALSTLVYGTHDPADFPFRGWGNPSEEVQRSMLSMFPAAQPYLHEYF